jgi:hypothetical protein
MDIARILLASHHGQQTVWGVCFAVADCGDGVTSEVARALSCTVHLADLIVGNAAAVAAAVAAAAAAVAVALGAWRCLLRVRRSPSFMSVAPCTTSHAALFFAQL